MLEIQGLTVTYGSVEAVSGLSFHVACGTVATLIGPNGAGKTTTLNALSGVVRPSRGKILFDGRDITRMSAHRRVSAGIVQVPEGRQVLAGMSVRENLELGGYRRPRCEVLRDMERMEERFPILRDRRNAPAGSLSGGEQQMLAIARGLMAKPKVLLLDEPTAGLDRESQPLFERCLAALPGEGVTVIISTHDADQSRRLQGKVLRLEAGRLISSEPVELSMNFLAMEGAG